MKFEMFSWNSEGDMHLYTPSDPLPNRFSLYIEAWLYVEMWLQDCTVQWDAVNLIEARDDQLSTRDDQLGMINVQFTEKALSSWTFSDI